MALLDLADHDILDLILGKYLSDEEREKMLLAYQESYTVVVGDIFNSELKQQDHDDMDTLLSSKDVTPEKIEQFYIDRIPQFQEKLIMLTLEFKKRFLLSVYQNKVEEYTDRDDKYGLAAWEQVFYDAQHDNWNEVARLINIIDGMTPSEHSTPPSPAN